MGLVVSLALWYRLEAIALFSFFFVGKAVRQATFEKVIFMRRCHFYIMSMSFYNCFDVIRGLFFGKGVPYSKGKVSVKCCVILLLFFLFPSLRVQNQRNLVSF